MDLSNATFNNHGSGPQIVAENYYAGRPTTQAAEQGEWAEELKTPEAMKYWQRLQEAGFVNEDFSRAQCSRQQAMYIAEAFAERLGIQAKWKVFERGWCINNLAQEKHQFQETGVSPEGSKMIDKIFET